MKRCRNKYNLYVQLKKNTSLIQFIKFGLVGVSNTFLSYIIDLLCFYVVLKDVLWRETIKIVITSALAFFVSVTNSYYWNSRYVFGKKEKKTINEHIKSFFKTVICYAITGLMVSPGLKMILSRNGVKYWLASIISLVVSIPCNFVMNKYWTYMEKK